MRLTVKKENKYNMAYKDKGVHLQFLYDANDAVKDLVNDTNAVIQKLGQLEDLEEELSIDLIKVIKAFKIIRNKWVEVGTLIENTWGQYNDLISERYESYYYCLTEDEYDLLKEVLTDE